MGLLDIPGLFEAVEKFASEKVAKIRPSKTIDNKEAGRKRLRKVEAKQQPAAKTNEVDLEDLLEAYKVLQKRYGKSLKDVKLVLNTDEVPAFIGGPQPGLAQYIPASKDTGSARIELSLPAIKRSFEARASRPRQQGERYTPRKLDAFTKSILRHEVGHVRDFRQTEITGKQSRTPKKEQITPKSRLNIQDFPHGLRFQIINRAMAGFGAEPTFEKIGLPLELQLPPLREMPRGRFRG